MTTNYSFTNISVIENPIYLESGFIMLRENGDYILREDARSAWVDSTKNNSTSAYTTKNSSAWTSPVKN